MAENTFTIPAQQRTIFVKMNGSLYKYKLNFPEFYVKHSGIIGDAWNIRAINSEGKLCFAPLLNVTYLGDICLGDEVKTKEEFVKALFCTKFTLDITSGMSYYIQLPFGDYFKTCEQTNNKFFVQWEKDGFIELRRC